MRSKGQQTPRLVVTVPRPLLPTPGDTRKHYIGFSSAETRAKKRRYGKRSEPYAQPIQPPPPQNCDTCNRLLLSSELAQKREHCAQPIQPPPPLNCDTYNRLLSSELAQTREHCAKGVALIPDEQVGKHNKEGKTSAQHTHSPVCRCNDRVPAMWKAFVEEDSLVPLCEALFYLATSKLAGWLIGTYALSTVLNSLLNCS